MEFCDSTTYEDEAFMVLCEDASEGMTDGFYDEASIFWTMPKNYELNRLMKLVDQLPKNSHVDLSLIHI